LCEYDIQCKPAFPQGKNDMENEDRPKFNTPKIFLLIGEEKHIVRLIQVNLERAGYVVATATNAKEALEKAESEHPDIITFDTELPDKDGFETLRHLGTNPKTKDIPIIHLDELFSMMRSGV